MRLGTRLLLSYIVVIAVTLGVITAVLLLFLNGRPAPTQVTYRQLGSMVTWGLRDMLTGIRPGQNNRIQLAVATNRLMEFANDNAVRILLVGTENHQVVFDSAGTFNTDLPLTWWEESGDSTTYFRQAVQVIFQRNEVETLAGGFSDPDGTDWLFVALQRPVANPTTILFAEQQPTQSLIDALSEFRDELARPIFQAGFIGLVAAIIMAALVSRTIARPLQHIASATAAVAEGHYDQQVPVTGPPEVREVAESVNHMSGEVRAAQQIQRDFLVNVSHDLKTPLTSIQGYSQAIIDGAAADPVKAAGIIYDEATRLNRMVVELTDLARLENGQLSMQMVSLDLGQIVTAIGERLTIMAQKKGLKINIDAPPMPEIQADGDRMAQVVTNLISNAIKYTQSGGSIRVKTQINNGGVELIVQDSGIGIPAEDLPRVFERFYQVDKARGPRRGTGLGLAIAQEIVQAHSGTISVTSAGAGKGSTFTVWLPSPQLKTVVKGKR